MGRYIDSNSRPQPSQEPLESLSPTASTGGVSSAGGTSDSAGMAGTASDEPTFGDQVAAGAIVYAASCQGCHGASGEGTATAPAVVGADALPWMAPAGPNRAVEYGTALDGYSWLENMPPNRGGSLSDEAYASIMAFTLSANGVDLTQPLDAASAEAVILNAE